MQTEVKGDNVTLCLWANLKKNPRSGRNTDRMRQTLDTQQLFHISGPCRFKGLNFKEAGMSFELPKLLAVSDIAVRILHTRYDHLSLLARMASQRVYTTSHGSVGTCSTSDTIVTTVTLTDIILLCVCSQVSYK